eukprot:4045799-Amphidinium_carterae.1
MVKEGHPCNTWLSLHKAQALHTPKVLTPYVTGGACTNVWSAVFLVYTFQTLWLGSLKSQAHHHPHRRSNLNLQANVLDLQ